jgi:hypothetical protein
VKIQNYHHRPAGSSSCIRRKTDAQVFSGVARLLTRLTIRCSCPSEKRINDAITRFTAFALFTVTMKSSAYLANLCPRDSSLGFPQSWFVLEGLHASHRHDSQAHLAVWHHRLACPWRGRSPSTLFPTCPCFAPSMRHRTSRYLAGTSWPSRA